MEEVLKPEYVPAKGGRPSKTERPLGKADLTKFARRLGQVSDEAIDYIIQVMRDSENPAATRMKAATWIVGTTAGLVKEVDRQTMMKKNLELIDKKIGEVGNNNDSDDNELTGGSVFSLEIVK